MASGLHERKGVLAIACALKTQPSRNPFSSLTIYPLSIRAPLRWPSNSMAIKKSLRKHPRFFNDQTQCHKYYLGLAGIVQREEDERFQYLEDAIR